MKQRAETIRNVKTADEDRLKRYRAAYGERAKAVLFELDALAIGKPVPDIVGEDLDGKPMKLSDYRGKVVLLDFWGHW